MLVSGVQLMRGVGDEIALRLDHLLGLRAGGVELASISSSVRASSATSSSVSVSGRRSDGSRVAAILRAAAVSEEIGRIARPATASPARSASNVPPKTPAPSRIQSRSIVASRSSWVSAYWT